MGRLKKNGKRWAALRREATKRGQTTSRPAPSTQPSVPLTRDCFSDTDATYAPNDADSESSESGPVSVDNTNIIQSPKSNSLDRWVQGSKLARDVNAIDNKVFRQEHRVDSNADIYPEITMQRAKRNTTDWRNRTGKTKKARAANMQPSIATIFKPVTRQRAPSPSPVKSNERMAVTAIGPTFEPNISSLLNDSVPSHQTTTASPVNSSPPPIPDDVGVLPEHSSTPVSTTLSTSSQKLRPGLDYGSLAKIILKLRQQLRGPKSGLSHEVITSRLVLVEALDQFRKLAQQLQADRVRLLESLKIRPRQQRCRILNRVSRIKPLSEASQTVARRFSRGPYFARRLREMAREILRTEDFPVSRQGHGANHASLLNHPDVRSGLELWVKGMVSIDDGGFEGQIHPNKLRHYVNQFLLPSLYLDDTISQSTAVRWLKKLGFRMCRVQKGIYVDGHERKDVVKSREKFIVEIFDHVLPCSYIYEGKEVTPEPPSLAPSQKIHYPIFHDETCIHANDQQNFVWMRDGEQPLRDKSRGRIVHVSDFILENCGRLQLSPEEIEAQLRLPIAPGSQRLSEPSDRATAQPSLPALSSYRLDSFDARRIIYPGSKHDPWWDMPQLIAQTKQAIRIFDTKFPHGIAVFIFDCSSAHAAFASDALLAHKMSRGPGGKQPKMHSTVVPSTGQVQLMVFPDDYIGMDKDGKPLAGQPKGMEQVLWERGLLEGLRSKHGSKLVGVCKNCRLSQEDREKVLREAKAKQDEVEGSGIGELSIRGISDAEEEELEREPDCCMRRVLSLQEDFCNEKPLLQLIIESAGHKCLFLPKFHCELNPIEMVWGQVKRRFRELTDGTFPCAKKLVPECLEAVTTDNIRRYFQHCWRYMDAYRMGLNVKQAAYAVKKYTSHRRIPANVMMDVNIISRSK